MSLTAPTNPKRPQSLTVSPSTRHPKKKKEDHAKIVTGSTTLIGTLAKQASIKSRHVLRHEVDPRDNSNEASDALLNIAKRTVKVTFESAFCYYLAHATELYLLLTDCQSIDWVV